MTSLHESAKNTNTFELSTERPDVTVRLFSNEDFDEFSNMTMKDIAYIRARSYGLDPAGIVTWAEDTVEGYPPSGVRLMMVRQDHKIAGCVILGSEDEKTENISYFAGKDFMGKGIMSAAVKAVVENEIQQGKDVVADVKRDNVKSIKLLGKAGFVFDHWSREYSEDVYIRKAPSPNEPTLTGSES